MLMLQKGIKCDLAGNIFESFKYGGGDDSKLIWTTKKYVTKDLIRNDPTKLSNCQVLKSIVRRKGEALRILSP